LLDSIRLGGVRQYEAGTGPTDPAGTPAGARCAAATGVGETAGHPPGGRRPGRWPA